MAKSNKRNSKGLTTFRIAIELLKETCTFLFAIAIGILNMIATIFE